MPPPGWVVGARREAMHPLYLFEGLYLTFGASRAASMAPSASTKWL